MFVYRIVATKHSGTLGGSGRESRWNPNDIEIVYTASSRSLACLENVVHLNNVSLIQSFEVMTINRPASIKIKTVRLVDLPANWRDYSQMMLTQDIGEQWVKENKSAILRVPSAVIEEEFNYLLNPKHEDFKLIKIVKTEPFIFDKRIKQ